MNYCNIWALVQYSNQSKDDKKLFHLFFNNDFCYEHTSANRRTANGSTR